MVWSADPLSMSARVERLVTAEQTRSEPAEDEPAGDVEEVS